MEVVWGWRHLGGSGIAVNVEFFWDSKGAVQLPVGVLVALDMVEGEIERL